MNPALEYIEQAPEPYRSIMIHLQTVIEREFPEIQLKYKWKLPFYYLDEKTMFCFLNYRKTFVDVGMPYGIQLTKNTELLVAGENRKMVRSMRFYQLDQINDRAVGSILRELYGIRATKIRSGR